MAKELIDGILPVTPTIKPIVPQETVTLEPNNATVSFERGMGSFKVNTILANIRITASESWVVVSHTYNDNHILVDYSYAENTGDESRTATINVSYTDLNGIIFNYPFTLVQNADVESVVLTPSFGNVLQLSSDSSTGTFTIDGAPFEDIAVSTLATWLKLSKGEDEFIYTVDENSAVLTREAVIFVTYKEYQCAFTVRQIPKTQKPAIILSKTSQTVGFGGTVISISFTVQNLDGPVIASSSVDWAEIRANSLSTNGFVSPVTITVSANPDVEKRTATITFVGGSARAVFVLTQTGDVKEPTVELISLNDVECSYDTTELLLPVDMIGIETWSKQYTDSDWLEEVTPSYRPDGYYLIVELSRNLTDKARTGNIFLDYKDNNGALKTATCKITQNAPTERKYFPIWKTQNIEFKGEPQEEIDYVITANGKTVHNARVMLGKDGKYSLELNELLRYYMKTVFDPWDNDYIQDTGGYMSGEVAVKTGDVYETYCEYVTWNDCSYNSEERVITNEPIEYKFDRRQMIPISILSKYGKADLVVDRTREAVGSKISRRYEISNSMQTAFCIADGYYAFYATATYGDNIEEINFKLDECSNATHCLYYQNAYGGIDYLLVRGNVKKKDNISRTTVKRARDTSKPSHSTVVTHTEIETTYEVWTHYLNDRQSKRMHHLVESPLVWLHDLETQDIIPVVMNDSTHEYKKRVKGEGLVYYKISLVEADKKHRT